MIKDGITEVVINGILWRYRIASGWYIFLKAKPAELKGK